MATLTINAANTELSFTAASAAGDEWPNDKDTFLLVQNGDASSHTATVTAQKTTLFVPSIGNVTVGNIAVAVAAGAIGFIHAPNAVYNNDSTGRATVTMDAVTSVTLAAAKLQRIG